MTLTIQQIRSALPLAPQVDIDVYGNFILGYCASNSINTPYREAAFLSQIGYESAWLTHTSENLNYSVAGLLAMWPSHFDGTSAPMYAHNPVKIANRAYANRHGNGDEASGDGWKYRGRGLIQLTFKDNYESFGNWAHIDAVKNPDSLSTASVAVMSAIWFWESNHLNDLADKQDITSIVKRISGGTMNLSRRLQAYDIALKAVS